MIEHLHLRQGQGGCFKAPFLNFTPPLTRIGTHSCRTCVCVYIPLSDKKCFIAHIDAHVTFEQNEKGEARESDWLPSKEVQGPALKEFTKKILEERVPELANGDYGAKAGKVGAVVICPYRQTHQGGVAKYTTGHYIVEAVNEFFNLTHSGGGDVTAAAAHGFVVDVYENKLTLLEYRGADAADLLSFNLWNSIPEEEMTEFYKKAIRDLAPKVKEKEAGEDYGFKDVLMKGEKDWTFRLGDDGQWGVYSGRGYE
ncbi:uncharacterized protein RCC_05053 [Ramularia collo-cygni]|uniref:Uncharacterized protein n=1 Tax=Ramularia collo-cygni TaxID=112498 RepID=A0A2D3V3E3_9PEZI|nr:uncharacterized protein RCC_05053 [Ramularia collo-cygni]CZT19207.1 uncharacterized protein RCC_05053 [Ramularia collo-cygni]